MPNVSMDGFADAMKEILDEFGKKATDSLPDAMRQTANETRKMLRSSSPGNRYARNWQYELKTNRVGGADLTIYNGLPGLTHLLEHGHVIRNGTGRTYGRTAAEVHIEPANEYAEKTVIENVIKDLERG